MPIATFYIKQQILQDYIFILEFPQFYPQPHHISYTYTLKREIINFSKKISRHLSKPDTRFTADMTYGMLAAGSCLLTDVADQLHENSKKINIVDRLSRYLDKGAPSKAVAAYLQQVKKMATM